MEPQTQQPAGQPQSPEQDTTALQRLWALKLLRENMFYKNPETYGYTDIAEDLPGELKPLGHILSNVLPSAAIISQDPDKRKRQIDEAIAKIKASKGAGEDVHKEMLHNAMAMGKGAILPGALLSLAVGKFGLRLPWAKKFISEGGQLKSLGRKLRSPIEINNLKRLVSSGARGAAVRSKLVKDTLHDTLMNVGLAAGTGAIYPYLANKTQVSDKSLEEARKIMEEQPYLTSLPASEFLSVLKNRLPGEEPSRMANVGIGVGAGAISGAAGAMLPSAATALISLLSGGKIGPKGGITSPSFLRNAAQGIKQNAIFGGGLGALSGLASKNVIDDEYQNIKQQVNPSSSSVQAQPVSALSVYRNEYKKPISYTL